MVDGNFHVALYDDVVSPASPKTPRLPAVLQWTAPGRVLIFVLAATSIWCLLAEMYHLVGMRTFFYAILLPTTALLYGVTALDSAHGDGRLCRAVVIGTLGGLVGAIAYDIFRLPFVYSAAWGLERVGIPQMPLFKVFPRFGALILGQPPEQSSYSLAAQLLGWAYHFSNGATFGVMFASAFASAKEAVSEHANPNARGLACRAIPSATLMAVGIELCLLASPYTSFFGIAPTSQFILVTVIAHMIFGIALGAYFAWHASRWRLSTA